MTETDIESSLLGNVPVYNESSTFIADELCKCWRQRGESSSRSSPWWSTRLLAPRLRSS